MYLVMTFKVTSNNIERGRGVRNVFHLFTRAHFRMEIQSFGSVSTILQWLVAFEHIGTVISALLQNLFYYIDKSVLVENRPLIKFI